MERFFNLLSLLLYKYHIRDHFISQITKAFPHDTTNYLELMAQSQYVFVNTDEYLDFPRPITNKIINIGGIGVRTASDRKLDPVSFL
jgi:hypothetical protein